MEASCTKLVSPLKTKSEIVSIDNLVSVPDKRHDILGGKLVGCQQVHQDARQLRDLLQFLSGIYLTDQVCLTPVWKSTSAATMAGGPNAFWGGQRVLSLTVFLKI